MGSTYNFWQYIFLWEPVVAGQAVWAREDDFVTNLWIRSWYVSSAAKAASWEGRDAAGGRLTCVIEEDTCRAGKGAKTVPRWT